MAPLACIFSAGTESLFPAQPPATAVAGRAAVASPQARRGVPSALTPRFGVGSDTRQGPSSSSESAFLSPPVGVEPAAALGTTSDGLRANRSDSDTLENTRSASD